MKTELMKKLRKIGIIVLSITLSLGILSTAFGSVVIALDGKDTSASDEAFNEADNTQNSTDSEEYVDPTTDYSNLDNEVELKENVKILTEEQSAQINSAITAVEVADNYGRDYLGITIAGNLPEDIGRIRSGDIIYLHGDETTHFGGDRIFQVDYINSWNGETYARVYEPYFEDVFKSLEICTSDMLTEENLVKAYYANGVTSHFGDIDVEMKGVSVTEELKPEVAPMVKKDDPEILDLGTEYTTEGDDLIVSIEYDHSKQDDDEDGGDSFFQADASFGIKGTFGIRDLCAYVVVDMPSILEMNELFIGVSGQTFVDIELYGKIEASANMSGGKKDLFIAELSGLNEKLLPIAVFEFKGTTPVYITNAMFDADKESIIPSLYLMLYADWEGNISLELSAGFEYAHSFNNGLRVFKNGEPALSFESYPYEKAYDAEDKDGLVWDITLSLEADTDLTLFGGSLLFYVAGVNIGEISLAKIGVEAKCDISISADSKDGFKILSPEETEFYIRGYLKLIGANVKLKADGKGFLKKLSLDADFTFTLLDITLFTKGITPDKYIPAVPISSMERPESFSSVISLVFDDSGSMEDRISSGHTKLQAAKEAAQTIVGTTKDWSESYKGNYGIGVIRFSDYAETVATPHIDYKYINDCIATVGDGGGTSIYSGIDMGVSQLEAVKSGNKMIILMTDGEDGNDSKTLESARKAAEAKIKIYTIGFGDSVDEELLKEIAKITKGEYRYANTENVMSIIGSFMYAQQAGNAKVLGDIESTVGEGESSEKVRFNVDDKSGDLIVTTAWPGSFLDTILIDPNGRVVDESYPGAVTDESKIPSTITVKDPLPGRWQMYVKGIETSYEQEPFYSIVSFKAANEPEINSAMTDLEMVAGYALPIGAILTLISAVLLIALLKKKKEI